MAAVDQVLEDLQTGQASSITSTRLQHLFGFQRNFDGEGKSVLGGQDLKAAFEPSAIPWNSKSVRDAKKPKRKPHPKQDFRIHEDKSTPAPLLPRAKCTLAINVLNTSMKCLNNAKKKALGNNEASPGVSKAVEAIPPPQKSVSASQALRERRNNDTLTPKCSIKQPTAPREPSLTLDHNIKDPDFRPAVIAECAGLALRALRTIDTSALDDKVSPIAQETSALALVQTLIVLGLDDLALRELRCVNDRLRATWPTKAKPQAKCEPSNVRRKPGLSARISPLELIHLDVDTDSFSELIPLVIQYHMQILQIVCKCQTEATVAEIARRIELDAELVPSGLILQHATQTKGYRRAAVQLKKLSQMVLGLCSPFISTSSADKSIFQIKSRSPLYVFELQTAALKTQRLIDTLPNDSPSTAQDSTIPFAHFVTTLLHNVTDEISPAIVYTTVRDAWGSLLDASGTTGAGLARFRVHMYLSRLGEKVNDSTALKWAQLAIADCSDISPEHPRRLAVRTRMAALALEGPPEALLSANNLCTDLAVIQSGLQKTLSGILADYDMLISELADLADRLRKDGNKIEEECKMFVRCVAIFASRFVSAHGGRSLEFASRIIEVYQSLSSPCEMSSWVTQEMLRMLLTSDRLESLSSRLGSGPVARAWLSSRPMISLSTMIKAFVYKTIQADHDVASELVFDDDNLPSNVRGGLLEWQLCCLSEIVHKVASKQTSQRLCRELICRLSQTFTNAEFPVRRLRALVLILSVRDRHPNLVPQSALEDFGDSTLIDSKNLGNDESLAPYVPELQASASMSQVFSAGPPNASQFKQPLLDLYRYLASGNTFDSSRPLIEDGSALGKQLMAVDDYLAMIGEDEARVPVNAMLDRIGQLRTAPNRSALLRLSKAYLSLGYVEKATEILDEFSRVESQPSELDRLQFYLVRAECFLVMDELARCREGLETAEQAWEQIQPGIVNSNRSKRYHLLLGQGWLLKSRYSLACGDIVDALMSGSHAVRILNRLWNGLERLANGETVNKRESLDSLNEPDTPDIKELIQGVSKFNLQSGKTSTPSPNVKLQGSSFWAALPLLCDALTHLAEIYMSLGTFLEANYYSEQAVKVASSVGKGLHYPRPCQHRCMFLLAAKQAEEAVLCLENSNSTLEQSSLHAVRWLLVRASLHGKDGLLEESVELLRSAGDMVGSLRSEEYLTSIECLHSPQDPAFADKETICQITRRPTETKASPSITRASASRRNAKAARSTKTKALNPEKTDGGSQPTAFCVLDKLRTDIELLQAILELKQGNGLTLVSKSCLDTLKQTPMWRQFESMANLEKIGTALESELSLSMLPESTLSSPALAELEQAICTTESFTSSRVGSRESSTAPKKARSQARNNEKHRKSQSAIETLIISTRQSLPDLDSFSPLRSTSDIHVEYSLLLKISLLLSSTAFFASAIPVSLREASLMDDPRTYATECRAKIARFDRDKRVSQGAFGCWPSLDLHAEPTALPTSKTLGDCIKLLPKSWTVVSLCVSDTTDELYIARYRSRRTPFVVRQPFVRQNSEAGDDEAFDYSAGRTELQDIIEMSNFSCHDGTNSRKNGAMTDWWKEREALDQRLHNLLMNIESLWFGGFKGILSQTMADKGQLDRFREAFEAILDRNLPSRQASRRTAKKLQLSDHILELFISLGDDKDGTVDLDEPLWDLLYFVADVLQFNGEHNAYDEIDFDQMIIETLDALRNYHDAISDDGGAKTHMVLVLDKRLQAFPWESLPCLDGASISRVDSMYTLYERLTIMRQGRDDASPQREPNHEDCQYTVPRDSGSYILNPAGDLVNTENTLGPVLSNLQREENSSWTSIVRREPTEENFKSALSASTLLYFGHGAGSQYVRPSTIRRLEKCSEVVWLMGCSSGAAKEYGELEPFSVPLEYMTAGQTDGSSDKGKCMAVVATLWDVTDKDIDRFSLSVGNKWGLFKVPSKCRTLPKNARTKRETMLEPVTPRQPSRPPKTPKTRKTPAQAFTPTRSPSRRRGKEGGKYSLAEAVATSRDTCYLRYLNGAAPVVFGVPVYLGD